MVHLGREGEEEGSTLLLDYGQERASWIPLAIRGTRVRALVLDLISHLPIFFIGIFIVVVIVFFFLIIFIEIVTVVEFIVLICCCFFVVVVSFMLMMMMRMIIHELLHNVFWLQFKSRIIQIPKGRNE